MKISESASRGIFYHNSLTESERHEARYINSTRYINSIEIHNTRESGREQKLQALCVPRYRIVIARGILFQLAD